MGSASFLSVRCPSREENVEKIRRFFEEISFSKLPLFHAKLRENYLFSELISITSSISRQDLILTNIFD